MERSTRSNLKKAVSSLNNIKLGQNILIYILDNGSTMSNNIRLCTDFSEFNVF